MIEIGVAFKADERMERIEAALHTSLGECEYAEYTFAAATHTGYDTREIGWEVEKRDAEEARQKIRQVLFGLGVSYGIRLSAKCHAIIF